MITSYLVAHSIAVLTTLASLAIAFRLFESRRTQQSTIAWLLAVVFMPFIAIPLYLLLGRRKFPRRAKSPSHDLARLSAAPEIGDSGPPMGARLLHARGVTPPRAGNSFDLLPTGEVAYARLLDLIQSAKKSIDLTIFILGDDVTGRAVAEALAESAARGVEVRVILDGVGSAGSRRYAARVLAAAGGQLRIFMPLWHSPIRGRTNLRSHRKLAVFDGEHVFAGGMNLANEYMGLVLPQASPPRWRDVAAVASGRVALDAEALFESDWTYCGGSKRPPREGDASVVHGEEILQVVPSGPDMGTDTVYDILLTTIFDARERIAIVTPYYVPDDSLQHALVLSARRGVRTEIVVPARSNHRIADFARRQLLRELTAAGVVVHYYGGGMVHAKAMVVDDTFAYIGSPNFDMRSFFLNYENALCVYSPDAIGQIRSFIDGLIAESTEEGVAGREHWVIEQVCRLLAPEL